MGGAVTNLAAVQHGLTTYDPEVVQGTVLDRAEIDRQIELYRGLDADGRRQIPGLQPARAEVILAGACIVRTIIDKLGVDAVTVSDRGLRHGVLHERFGPSGVRPTAPVLSRPALCLHGPEDVAVDAFGAEAREHAVPLRGSAAPMPSGGPAAR